MTKRMKRTARLIQQSLRVIHQNKKLIFFPLMSSIFILILLAFIIAPITQYEKTQITLHQNQPHIVFFAYVIVLILLFIIHLIAIYFNAAMTYNVNQYFEGKIVALKEGFNAANRQFIKLYHWNVYASTLGILINLFQPFLREFSFYKKMFQGLRWGIATYLVLPVIMFKKMGPIKSIQCSAELIRNTWGQNLKTNFGFIPWLVFSRFLTLIPLIIGLIKGGHQNIIIGTATTLILIIISTTISSVARTILACVLFIYAEKNTVVPEFNEELIKNAFVERED